MTITIDENERFTGNEFTPFHDSDGQRTAQSSNSLINATQGYDTRIFDRFRQGVSIRSSKHVYGATQPKIWAGNLHHYVKVSTLGQARDFTEFENDNKFEELPEFNPVWYIEDQNYPRPIVFNDGPQQAEEATIEPFVIPFKKASIYGNHFPRSIKASLEDGNNFQNIDGGTTRIQQFVEYEQPKTPWFFLDEGAEYIGPEIPTGSFLDTAYNPVALYTFNGDILDKSGNSFDLSLAAGTEQYTNGPFPGSQALLLDTFNAFSSSVIPKLHLSKSMTMEAVINADPVRTGNGRYIASMAGDLDLATPTEETSILYSLKMSSGGADDHSLSVSYGSGSVLVNIEGRTENNIINDKNWFHVAFTRNSASHTTIYVDGVDVLTFNHGGNPAVSSSIAKLQVGWLNFVSSPFDDSLMFSGSLSSLKIIDKELTKEEIQSEYKKVLPYKAGEVARAYRNSIVIDGFSAFIQRDVVPFNDTRDEQIVKQISTTDTTFISALKKLKFGIDEDIRGTYDRKSATAGSVVYGNGMARYGTDSIAFSGTGKGS